MFFDGSSRGRKETMNNTEKLRMATALSLQECKVCLRLAGNDYDEAYRIARDGIKDELISRILTIEARLDYLENTKF